MADFSILFEHGLFHLFAGLITLVSAMVVLSQHPVKSAVFLVVDLFLLAGLYATMDAHFIAAIQVLVYAGAIVVLFVFVIMLLNLQHEELSQIKFSAPEAGALVLTLVSLIIVLFQTFGGTGGGLAESPMTAEAIEAAGGNTKVVSLRLFSNFIWPFELASMLILLAIVASIVIAKKDKIKQGAE